MATQLGINGTSDGHAKGAKASCSIQRVLAHAAGYCGLISGC